MLTESKTELIAVEANYNGEMVYKVTDIIGLEPDLEVENVKGSGLIAGETSSACISRYFYLDPCPGKNCGYRSVSRPSRTAYYPIIINRIRKQKNDGTLNPNLRI
jgi:hypothetical protein